MNYQNLFDHMSNEHGVTLLENELQEIHRICESEKLKGLLEEVREFESDLSKFGNLMNGQFSKTFIKGFTAHQIHIATRIEELIGENTKPTTP